MMAVFAWGMTWPRDRVNEFVQGRTPYRFRILSGIFIVLLAAALAAARFAADPAQGKLVLAAGRHLAAGLGCVFAASIVWGLCARAGGPALRRALAPLTLGVLALAWGRDLLVNDRPFWTGIGEEPYRYWLTHHWALRNWERDEVPVRYIQLGNELSNQALTLSDYGPPNFREIASVHGYHPVAYGRYFDLLSRLGFTHPNFARLFGMQYMIAPVEAGVPPPGWQIVRQSDDKRFYLLYNPDMAYVRPVRHIQVVDDWPALLDRLADKNFNPYESTTVTFRDVDNNPEYDQKSIPLQDIRLNARVFPRRAGLDRAAPDDHAPDRSSWPSRGRRAGARSSTPRPHRAQLLRLDGYFIGIAAPVGESVIQLYYDPASQRLGLY